MGRLLALSASLSLIGLLTACGAPVEPTSQSGEHVTILGQRVEVVLARSKAEQSLGLGRRDGLAWDSGMLFLYDRAGFYSFWMKEMRFDIDIVWIRDDRIVDISHGVRHDPGGTGDKVRPRELVNAVLEVPAGYAASHGWRPGTHVELDLRSD